MNSLLEAARKSAENAHCPYSKFRVGAAVKTESGEIITGCNIENASYGLSICAERVAIFTAKSAGHQVTELAVSCVDADKNAPESAKTPCGACRQVMAEFLPDDALIHVDGVGTLSLKELLPKSFRL